MKIKLINEINTELAPLEQILKNREIEEDVDSFLSHDWSVVQSPMALKNINIAGFKILDHLKTAATIAILVDPDADGLTSSAILINYLKDRHKEFGGHLPELTYILHDDKTHGLADTQVMLQLRDLIKPALLIIPDASGSNEQYKALNDIGIDVVVIDHHENMSPGNDTTAIVVNNQQSPEYKNKALSGAGMVWQLCRWFDRYLESDIEGKRANKWLDLVAVGLVADVMSLASPETRFLVKEGLENIHSKFLKQCLSDMSFSLGEKYTPTGVSFYIGPLFNAVLRIGEPQEKELLFRALLDDDAEELIPSGKRGESGKMVPLVVEALRQATNAKARQKRQQDKLTALIDDVIQKDKLYENKIIIIGIEVDDYEESQRALSGLVANKLQETYQRPAILLFDNGDGSYSGSCRAPSNIEEFKGFREQCEASGKFIYCAGHSAAFGVKINIEYISEVQDYFNEQYKDISTEPTYYCDYILDANDPRLEDIIFELGKYKDIWGQGIPEPIIAVQNVKVGSGNFTLLSAKKNPTLKFSLPHQVSAIKFHSSMEEFEALMLKQELNKTPEYYNLTLIGKCSINEWNDRITPQILVDDYNIVGVEYDF